MPYATPARYLQSFGLTEAVQLLADEEQLLTAQLLKDALARVDVPSTPWTGTPSSAEQAAATAAADRLVRQLAISSNLMDGYLRSAVTLPLPPGDASAGSLEECCLALTRCGIADDADNATERMDKCCETWRKWLVDIAAGRVTLVTSSGASPARSGGTRVGQAESSYDWGRFGGVR